MLRRQLSLDDGVPLNDGVMLNTLNRLDGRFNGALISRSAVDSGPGISGGGAIRLLLTSVGLSAERVSDGAELLTSINEQRNNLANSGAGNNDRSGIVDDTSGILDGRDSVLAEGTSVELRSNESLDGSSDGVQLAGNELAGISNQSLTDVLDGGGVEGLLNISRQVGTSEGGESLLSLTELGGSSVGNVPVGDGGLLGQRQVQTESLTEGDDLIESDNAVQQRLSGSINLE